MKTKFKRRTALALAVGGMASLIRAHRQVFAAQSAQISVYADPNCGCCGHWATHLKNAGFDVTVHRVPDLGRIKSEAGVPFALQSCHTAMVDGYVIEGHVPAAEVKRLLAERPAARGLSVPGMPIGSPGMEQGDIRESYEVVLFQDDGTTSVFAQY